MNNNKYNILLGAILILNVIILIVVLSINDDKLNNMQNSFNSQLSNVYNNLYNQISYLEQTIRQMKEEEQSILSDYTITPGKPNIETFMSDVTLNITPKAFDENTKAVFYLGGKQVDMERNGNVFTGKISVPVSRPYHDASVSLTQNGVTQTQVFNDSISFYEFFAKMDASFEGSRSYSDNVLKIDGSVYYSFNSPYNEKAKSVHIYGVVNKNDRIFLEALDKNNLSEQIFNLKDSFPMKNGDKLDIYIKLITTNDITYLYHIGGTQIEADGQLLGEYIESPGYTIYDKQGNEIFVY